MRSLFLLYLPIITLNATATDEISIRMAGKKVEAIELFRGYSFLLKETWYSALKVSKDTEYIQSLKEHLEEALRIQPIGTETISISDKTSSIPIYDMKELVQTVMIRAGIYEKKIASAFDGPLSQLIGSTWTYWTLLCLISSNPKKYNDISFDDLLAKAYTSFKSTWGRIIIPQEDQEQLALYASEIQYYQENTPDLNTEETCSYYSTIEQDDDAPLDQHEYIQRLKELPPYDPIAHQRELEQKLTK